MKRPSIIPSHHLPIDPNASSFRKRLESILPSPLSSAQSSALSKNILLESLVRDCISHTYEPLSEFSILHHAHQRLEALWSDVTYAEWFEGQEKDEGVLKETDRTKVVTFLKQLFPKVSSRKSSSTITAVSGKAGGRGLGEEDNGKGSKYGRRKRGLVGRDEGSKEEEQEEQERDEDKSSVGFRTALQELGKGDSSLPKTKLRKRSANSITRPQRGGSGGSGGNGGNGGDGGELPPIVEEFFGDTLPENLRMLDVRMIELVLMELIDRSPMISWNDIAGLEFAKKCVQEIIVWPMKRPDLFTGLRGPPKGVLLFGPPGTGKTLIGKAIASETGAKFFAISASSLMSKWVGEAEKMVRTLFCVARALEPSVVFVDEIDSLLSQRSSEEMESTRRVKTEFLVQLDGASSGGEDRVLVIGATNRPQELDEAARRRLVKRLYIPLPNSAARKQLVKNLFKGQKHSLQEEEIDIVVERSKGYSGADLRALCSEAAMSPIRDLMLSEHVDIGSVAPEDVPDIHLKDFDSAFFQVRASVGGSDLKGYVDWNEQFGSFPMP
eukprot:TRINITY_DN964_c0_g1_i1.p1 TRINITY_DN964_c0_g1~~TRINITY_DN964_c0_g1_i1.p1  ORF type:complete len:553 (+),score=176.54 TRINITY_DN964_c0_g1_i1:92-1750(+)